MSEKNKKLSISFDGFGGIDHNLSHSRKTVADDIVNFRITKDGSLKKRPGYRLLSDLGSDIRAVYSMPVNGKDLIFVLCEERLFSIDPATGDAEMLGSVNSYSGRASFFSYRGILFLVDGSDIYKYSDGDFSIVVGYIPLIGENWGPNIPGKILESRNIINNYGRVTYVVPKISTAYFHPKYPVKSIKAVYVNGSAIPESRYEFNERFQTVDILELYEGDFVEVHLEYEPLLDDLKHRLLNSCSAALFGSSGYIGIFLCGGNGSHTVFPSVFVDTESLEKSKSFLPRSDVVYFPEYSQFEVGDGICEIKAVVRHRNKILIFTENDVWMTSPEIMSKENIPAVSINATIGCSADNGAISVRNDTVSIGKSAIWLWSGDADDQHSCSATNISHQINDELCLYGLSNCGIFFDQFNDELWIHSKTSDIAWVYNTEIKMWYKYKGICAEQMIALGNRIAFINNGKIFIIDEDLTEDILEDRGAVPIEAYYYSAVNDFGSEKLKNLTSLSMLADLNGEPLNIEFQCDNGEDYQFSLTSSSSEHHSIISKRLFSGRFCCTGIKISSNSLGCQSIHRLTINTR